MLHKGPLINYKYLFYMSLALFSACAPVKFSLSDKDCASDKCIVVNNSYQFNYNITAGGGKVDILFVDDNSASMSFEQRNLASRFSHFIKRLEDRNIDYRIAVTTTDISNRVTNGTANNEPRPINGNGAFQDGKLIYFSSGSPFLTPIERPVTSQKLANHNNLFKSVIERPETKQCEDFIAQWIKNNGLQSTDLGSAKQEQYSSLYKDNCPSGDERGIYSAFRVLTLNPASFIRNDSYLVIVFLSDEEIRSNYFYKPSVEDGASNLVNYFISKYSAYKTMKTHALVVKDSACLNQQNSQTLGTPIVPETLGFVQASIGNEYLKLTKAGWGISGDICSGDFTTQLGQINASIEEQITEVRLKCSNPENLIVTVTGDQTISATTVGNILKLNKQLPVGTNINLQYKCKELSN